MRIAFDAKRLFQNFSGLGNYSRTLVANLARYHSDVQIDLFSPNLLQHPRTRHFLDSDLFTLHEAGKKWKPVWRTFGLSREVMQTGCNIYHGLSQELPYGLHSNKCASVVTVHDLIFLKHPKTYSWANRQIYHAKCKSACKRADIVLAISESTKNDLISLYGIREEKISVIYQACDPVFYALSSEAERIEARNKYSLPEEFFIYVGRCEERKNIELILKALMLFRKDERPKLVMVAAKNSYQSKLRKLIARLDLSQSVQIVDGVESLVELRALLNMARAMVYPSFYEGFGLPIAEALLCKTAVIASGTSSLPEAGGPDALYIDPHSEKSLYLAMKTLWLDKQKASELALAGHTYAKAQFDAEKLSAKLVNLYKSLL